MIRFTTGALVLLALAGCSSAPTFNDNSRDPQAYARDVKEIALTAVNTARHSREPADALTVLVRELEDQQKVDRPVGEFKGLYAQLLAEVQPLLAACEKAQGRIPDLASRLDAVQRIANQLPGEVQVSNKR